VPERESDGCLLLQRVWGRPLGWLCPVRSVLPAKVNAVIREEISAYAEKAGPVLQACGYATEGKPFFASMAFPMVRVSFESLVPLLRKLIWPVSGRFERGHSIAHNLR
jgi:hypothetical protein